MNTLFSFRQFGPILLPARPLAYLFVTALFAFLIEWFMRVESSSITTQEALKTFLPVLFAVLLVYYGIAWIFRIREE
jgi:hypothetical protein